MPLRRPHHPIHAQSAGAPPERLPPMMGLLIALGLSSIFWAAIIAVVLLR
ncbi:hypothetical protein [Sphingomonas hengshuiensis]|nr:hypothetical protein [Sphingomonas hengshuiensis]